jgi:hypothetical protein
MKILIVLISLLYVATAICIFQFIEKTFLSLLVILFSAIAFTTLVLFSFFGEFLGGLKVTHKQIILYDKMIEIGTLALVILFLYDKTDTFVVNIPIWHKVLILAFVIIAWILHTYMGLALYFFKPSPEETQIEYQPTATTDYISEKEKEDYTSLQIPKYQTETFQYPLKISISSDLTKLNE